MNAIASIQWLVGVIRCHPQGGDWRTMAEYDWGATIARIDEDTVELMGVDKPLTTTQQLAIARAVHEQGYRWIVRRREDGSVNRIDCERAVRFADKRSAASAAHKGTGPT